MITVKTQVDTKIYNRVKSFQDAIKETLRNRAVESANGEELDWSTAKYVLIPLVVSSRCGCAKRSEVVLSVNVVGE